MSQMVSEVCQYASSLMASSWRQPRGGGAEAVTRSKQASKPSSIATELIILFEVTTRQSMQMNVAVKRSSSGGLSTLPLAEFAPRWQLKRLGWRSTSS